MPQPKKANCEDVLKRAAVSVAVGISAGAMICGAVLAQDGPSSATVMWGTGADSSVGSMHSSIMHERNGVAAAQVNAAELGLLLGQSAINMTAVGSQTIVSVEIVGHENDVDIDADQSATNSGDQSVDGTIVLNDPMVSGIDE